MQLLADGHECLQLADLHAKRLCASGTQSAPDWSHLPKGSAYRSTRRSDPVREEESNGRRRNLRDRHPADRRRVPRVHQGRPGDLGVRRTRGGRDDAPCVPQRGADGRAHVRQAPRPRPSGCPHDPHGHRRRHVHAPVLPRPEVSGGVRRRPRRDRGVGPHDVRLDGPLARLQGGVPRHARRERGLLRALPGEREALVQGGAGALPLLQPRDHQPADRPPARRRRGARRVHPRRQGDRRGPHRQRREGRRHGVGAHALQLHRPLRGRADQDQGLRGHLRRADGRPGREAHLPAVVRLHGGGDGEPVRLPALQPARRERHGDDLRLGPGPVGERLRLRRRRQDQRVLPGLRVHPALHDARLHAVRGEAGLHRRAHAQGGRGDGDEGLPRRAVARRRGHRLPQPVLGPDGLHGAQPRPVDRRHRAPEPRPPG